MGESIQKFIDSNKTRINRAYSVLITFQYNYSEVFFESMNLHSYCLGKRSHDGFCYALENDTKDLGYIGGYSNYKYGVFFSKKNDDYRYLDIYENEEKALSEIKAFLIFNARDGLKKSDGIFDGLAMGDNVPFPLKYKTYYLYHPGKILPIYSDLILSKIIQYSGYNELLETNDFLSRNLLLTKFLIEKYGLQKVYTEKPEKIILGLYYFLENELKLREGNILVSFHEKWGAPGVNLLKDNWDDFGYKTTYSLYLNEGFGGTPVFIGSTKIIGPNPEITNTSEYKIEFPFTHIGDSYCSFANHESFYIEIKESLGRELSFYILQQLNDLIFKQDSFFEKFKQLEAFGTSLLRDQGGNIEYIKTCLKAYNSVDIKANDYYISPYGRVKEEIHYSNGKKVILEFDLDFTKDKFEFYRIHALIGKNGIGKTTTLFKLGKLLTTEGRNNDGKTTAIKVPQNRMTNFDVIHFAQTREQLDLKIYASPKNNFSNIIGISYEAFTDEAKGLFHYLNNTDNGIYCSGGSLVGKIQTVKNEKSNYFKQKIREIFNSENLHEIDIDRILETPEYTEQLSSGYKVLLSTVMDIILNIKPNSLILFDEPETHLHPEFVSILIRMLYVLLDEFKSYMIIGTHSPIIIQQIPSKYITKIINNGDQIVAKSLEIESLGNSLTEIIYDVFGGEQEDIFYKIKIMELKSKGISIDELYEFLGNKISLNLKIYIDTIYQE